jgi:putative nucleotidyltransferase with HDIG domain
VLRDIEASMDASADLGGALNTIIGHITHDLPIDAASILLVSLPDEHLTHAASTGFRTDHITATRLKPGEGLPGIATITRGVLRVPSLDKVRHSALRNAMIQQEQFTSYMAFPLVAKANVLGVMEIFHRAPLHLDSNGTDFLEMLAAQAARAVEEAQLYEGMRRKNAELTTAYDRALEGWVAALDMRHKETEDHSQRVAEMAVAMARAYGMSESEIVHVRRGALLHDIGKLAICDNILNKKGPLTPEERTVIEQHPEYAYRWLSHIEYLTPALDIPYCHHEKWDGTGYPRGLKGEEIPIAARLFAVVDVWDALTSDRSYRPAWSTEQAREYIEALAGIHFDPLAVDLFFKHVAPMGSRPESPSA